MITLAGYDIIEQVYNGRHSAMLSRTRTMSYDAFADSPHGQFLVEVDFSAPSRWRT